ncbi:hypothetical protein N0V93_010221 [Gnomoniopsis smithogilvyi]|uniref:Tetratricopeptide repeat protein n=1 Tax=Gnomoniopsis smithogilvyi TaxID=1191159 RepID=A0A9W8YLX6_9PEZI|nr:hypothetical protein N0V93_010221 [Gnomoniopsis smithogilvyi]
MADRSPSDASQKQVEVVPELQEEKENKESIRFPPEEEAELLRESNSRKSTANSLYAHGEYHQALDIYSQATEICPNYLDYELALLQTNIAACHLKLHEWKNAITAATSSLDKLDKLDADIALEVKAVEDATAIEDPGPFADADHEIVSPGASRAALVSSTPFANAAARPVPSQRLSDSKRIRYKALMRRARARTELGGWQNLDGAHADYTALQSMDNLTRDDRRLVAAQLALLPAHIKEAKEKEVAQMWDQLKQASRPT